MTVAAAAQQTIVVQQATIMAQPAVTIAARSAISTATAGLKAAAPGMSQVQVATKAASAANNEATKAGSGPSIFFTIGQMQMAGASGVFAPDERSTFRAVAGSMEWTMQVPSPLWDVTSEWRIVAGSFKPVVCTVVTIQLACSDLYAALSTRAAPSTVCSELIYCAPMLLLPSKVPCDPPDVTQPWMDPLCRYLIY
jgi:hypothetical protein